MWIRTGNLLFLLLNGRLVLRRPLDLVAVIFTILRILLFWCSGSCFVVMFLQVRSYTFYPISWACVRPWWVYSCFSSLCVAKSQLLEVWFVMIHTAAGVLSVQLRGTYHGYIGTGAWPLKKILVKNDTFWWREDDDVFFHSLAARLLSHCVAIWYSRKGHWSSGM